MRFGSSSGLVGRRAELAGDDHLASECLNVDDRTAWILTVRDHHQLLAGTDEFLCQPHCGGVRADHDHGLAERILRGSPAQPWLTS